MPEHDGGVLMVTEDPQVAIARRTLELLERQAAVTEEIRDQFAEHLELQRQVIRLLVAERR